MFPFRRTAGVDDKLRRVGFLADESWHSVAAFDMTATNEYHQFFIWMRCKVTGDPHSHRLIPEQLSPIKVFQTIPPVRIEGHLLVKMFISAGQRLKTAW